MRKIGIALAGVLMTLASALAVAQPAGATIQPSLANGNYNIVEANGHHAVWAASPLDAGEQVTEATGLGRIWTFSRQTSYGGNDAGFISSSSGNVLAMNNNCNGAVLKLQDATFGTIWEAKPTGAPHTYWLVSRACDQQQGSHNTVSLAGFDITGRQFTACGDPPDPNHCAGLFLKMTLAPA